MNMKLGLVFPTCDIGSDPIAIRDYVEAAEGLGFDSLLCFDHVLGAVHADRNPPLPGPYDETFPFHEPFVLLAWIAGFTRRIELATGVLVLPQRPAALVAKQAAELQLLSRGRLRLGVGAGWNRVESEALGFGFADRGQRLNEQVDVLRRLWSEPVVDYHGRFHRIDRAGILPRPASPIPIWFGGASPQTYERAARLGDGFVFRPDDREYGPALAGIRERMQTLGRDASGFGAECTAAFALGPDHWLRLFEHWRGAGGTHFSVQVTEYGAARLGARAAGVGSTSDHIRALERFMAIVGPARASAERPGRDLASGSSGAR